MKKFLFASLFTTALLAGCAGGMSSSAKMAPDMPTRTSEGMLIGPNGRAQEARIQRSSGFERLDEIALETARDRWRYVPGTRNGVPEAMWFNVPINFVLE